MRTLAIIAVFTTALAQAEPLDRIAVSIGNHVITESALIVDLRVGAFLDRAPVDLSVAAKRRAAERLVDQVLILREATESHLALPTEQNALALLNELKSQYGALPEYLAALKRYRIEEVDLVAQLHAGLISVTFTDLRFRPAIQIPEEELRAYYVKLNTQETFEETRDKIEALLTQERTSTALDQWLVTARAAARVQFRQQVFR
ncbi:MAG: hypothetical protein ABIR70_03735 [Bryobacteraceae bacterium]